MMAAISSSNILTTIQLIKALHSQSISLLPDLSNCAERPRPLGRALALFKGRLEYGKRYPLTTLQTIANPDDMVYKD
jgi:hypothetical protein